MSCQMTGSPGMADNETSEGPRGDQGGASATTSFQDQLAARDPDLLRMLMPLLQKVSDHYFHAEVRGMERVPDQGPVLFVGNHSGGNVTPDSWVFATAFARAFGVDRPLYWLAHRWATSAPGIGAALQSLGIVRAGQGVAEAILERDGCVVVYPGGEFEAHRPWTARHEIRFAGRSGFVELARRTSVPLVPIVAIGGHDTYLPLTDGRGLARRLGLDRYLRMEVLPVSIALPWGLNIGDLLGHLPLPARIEIEVLAPVDVSRFQDDETAYEHITGRMQRTLDALAAGR